MSIIDWLTENKKWLLFWFAAAIFLSISFAAGYLVAEQKNPAPIIIEQCDDIGS